LGPATDAITDLGGSGGWEGGVRQARIAGTGAVAIGGGEGRSFIHRHLEGGAIWSADLPGEGSSLTFIDNQLTVVYPTFTSDFPVLLVTRFDLESGATTDSMELSLLLAEGLSIGGGFCFFADAFPSGLSCDQTYGPPILIDLQTGNTRTHPTQLRAVATHPRD